MTEHGYPFEVVIPCASLEEANAERADLHVAVEARSIIREVGEERARIRQVLAESVPSSHGWDVWVDGVMMRIRTVCK